MPYCVFPSLITFEGLTGGLEAKPSFMELFVGLSGHNQRGHSPQTTKKYSRWTFARPFLAFLSPPDDTRVQKSGE